MLTLEASIGHGSRCFPATAAHLALNHRIAVGAMTAAAAAGGTVRRIGARLYRIVRPDQRFAVRVHGADVFAETNQEW